MILNETYSLANDVKIPKLGLGTWFIDDDKTAEAVRNAVKLGYRLIAHLRRSAGRIVCRQQGGGRAENL